MVDDKYMFCGGYFTKEQILKFQEHIQNELNKIHEEFKHQPCTNQIMAEVQYEVDKLYGEGIFKVVYDRDFDPYIFGVMIVNDPCVRQMVLEVNLDE